MARTIISRNELVPTETVALRAPVGTLVRFTYTWGGTEFVCRGIVTGHEGEQVHVRVTHHEEFGVPKDRTMKMMWSARFCQIIRRPARTV